MCMRKSFIWRRARASYGAPSSIVGSLSIDHPLCFLFICLDVAIMAHRPSNDS
jgi:hypothetical protein